MKITIKNKPTIFYQCPYCDKPVIKEVSAFETREQIAEIVECEECHYEFYVEHKILIGTDVFPRRKK